MSSFTKWYDSPCELRQVDWNMVYQRYWSDNLEDVDRQRRKQAEFLVYRFCSWSLIKEIGVHNLDTKRRVEDTLSRFDAELRRPVEIRQEWYYY